MDASAWETCKENIQPLKSGRKVDALSRALTSKAAAVTSAAKDAAKATRESAIKYDAGFGGHAALLPSNAESFIV